MSSTTADKTIEVLRGYFATLGLPEELVSDNSPQFVSRELDFFNNNRVKHIQSLAYHPASDGAAERLVQNLKRALDKGQRENMSLPHCSHNCLFCYRSTQSRVVYKMGIQNQVVSLTTHFFC